MLLAGNNKLRPPRRISDAGFTLVEMMTVLVIIGLMSSAVILTLPRDRPALETQSDALLRGANVMAQSSLIAGTPSALGLSKDHYAFMAHKNGEWEAVQSFEFIDGISAKLQKGETEINLSGNILPLIVFEPNGLSTPFSLTLSNYENSSVLQSSGDGRVLRGGDL